MAKARSKDGNPASKRAFSWTGDAVARPGLARLTVLAHPQPSPAVIDAHPPLPPSAAGGAFVIDISEDLEITANFLCKVPVSNDVLHCTCGGVMSQRLNESLFCRTCGKEGSR